MKNIIFRKIAKINNFFIFHFNKINEFIKIINHKFKNISSFNRYLIFLIIILFLYLFFLSIPSLYDKGVIQTKLNKIIEQEYNINISLSSDIKYNILPKPHFLIKNAKIFTNNPDAPIEVGQIKKLRAYIDQRNFFKKNKIGLVSISINDANFSIHQKDMEYLKEYLETKLSKKKLSISNSKFFYIDENEEVISIFPISKVTMYYDDIDSKNTFISKGEFFSTPYTLNWNKDFNNQLNSTFLRLNELNIRMENFTDKKASNLSMKNYIFFRSAEIETDILIEEKSIKLKSSGNSKIKNNKLNYTGEIFLNPFQITTEVNLGKLDFRKSIFDNDLLRRIFEIKHLYNQNLSLILNLRIEKLVKNKLFKSSNVLVNLSSGNINFNNSIFSGDVGNLNLINSNILNFKDDLIFNGNFRFNIISKNEFYRLFQINKKNRKDIDNFYFDMQYNLTKNKIKISNLIFDPGKVKLENELSDFLNENNDELKINNWIDFKNFVKKIFVDYYEG